jgi:asparaginyl-tRNA synthetase
MKYWFPYFEDELNISENDIVVGHSSGALAIMKYAETHKLGGSVLVGTYYTDLGYEDEKVLADDFGKPFFVYDYPTAIKAFYCKTYKDHPEVEMSVDMMVPRIGEISTGGAREDNKDLLKERMKAQDLKPEDYEWYLDLRRYGTVPHVGFGMGLERLLVWMCDLDNIIDAIPFPRTTRRFYP